jgi:hypothetical protein
MTYYHFEGSLVQPTMEEPVGLRKYLKWRDHLRSLPKIKVEGKLKEGWVEEGKDFVISEGGFATIEADSEGGGSTRSGSWKVAIPVSETEANAETDEFKGLVAEHPMTYAHKMVEKEMADFRKPRYYSEKEEPTFTVIELFKDGELMYKMRVAESRAEVEIKDGLKIKITSI